MYQQAISFELKYFLHNCPIDASVWIEVKWIDLKFFHLNINFLFYKSIIWLDTSQPYSVELSKLSFYRARAIFFELKTIVFILGSFWSSLLMLDIQRSQERDVYGIGGHFIFFIDDIGIEICER